MSLLAGVLGFARQVSSLRDTEVVRVGVFMDTTDPVTLRPVRALVEAHYEGAGHLTYPTENVSERVAAGQQVGVQAPILKIPVGAGPLIREGDEVEVVSSTVDDTLVGRRYLIDGWPQSGQVSAHRYPLKETS